MKKINKEKISNRLKQILELGDNAKNTYPQKRSSMRNHSSSRIDYTLSSQFHTESLSFLKNIFGESSEHYNELLKIKITAVSSSIKNAIGIMKAAEKEIDEGWLFTVKELISAEVFSDYLEMAEHLLESNFKDAAAIIIGSTLENHLKHLCEKNNIEIQIERNEKLINKKADVLNADLKKAEIYNAMKQKQVTSWLDLRNNAAHGNYNEYRKEDVKGMYTGVLDFINETNI